MRLFVSFEMTTMTDTILRRFISYDKYIFTQPTEVLWLSSGQPHEHRFDTTEIMSNLFESRPQSNPIEADLSPEYCRPLSIHANMLKDWLVLWITDFTIFTTLFWAQNHQKWCILSGRSPHMSWTAVSWKMLESHVNYTSTPLYFPFYNLLLTSNGMTWL